LDKRIESFSPLELGKDKKEGLRRAIGPRDRLFQSPATAGRKICDARLNAVIFAMKKVAAGLISAEFFAV
jgi:hypothetical protein